MHPHVRRPEGKGTKMNIAKDKVVSIDYTVRNGKGVMIDSSVGADPLEYLHGAGDIISGLEQALEGKKSGDSFSVTIEAKDAYGLRNDELIMIVPKEQFSGVDTIEPGMQFHAEGPSGVQVITVTKVEGDSITIDANHPLAGEDLNFDVTVKGVRDASPEEIEHGHIHGDSCCGDDGCGDDCGCGEDGCGCGCGGL